MKKQIQAERLFRSIQSSIIVLILALTINCKPALYQVTQTDKRQISIDSTLQTDSSYLAIINPYKYQMEDKLNRELAYNPIDLDKKGANSTLGNFISDILLQDGNELYQQIHPGQHVDLSLMNIGGLRRTFAPGVLTVRSMYELMPFENQAVVLTLSGKDFQDMVEFLRKSDKYHPIAGISVNRNGENQNLLVDGKPFDINQNYRVITNDYLAKGGDQMSFFANPIQWEDLDITLRDMFIQHLEKIDTVRVNNNVRYIEN